MIEYLFYLGYACSAAEVFGMSVDAQAYKRLSKKFVHAVENFGGVVLLSSSEWELLQKAKSICNYCDEVI